jgi:hypothetical protein
MSRYNAGGLVVLSAPWVGIALCLSPAASADAVPSWNGEYAITFFYLQKGRHRHGG